MEKSVKIAILGAGSAGLYALTEVKKETDDFVLIDGGPLGTTCARVGCIPSKYFIGLGDHHSRLPQFAVSGVGKGEAATVSIPKVLEEVRRIRDRFVEELLEKSVRKLGKKFIRGHGRFVGEGLLEVEGKRIRADRVIIATGSSPIVPEAWQGFGERIITTDNLYDLPDLPASLAVVGLGAIGLEMALTFQRLGIEVFGFDLLNTVAGLQDPVVAAETVDIMRRRFKLRLGEEAYLEDGPQGKIRVRTGDKANVVDAVLVSLGRRPNLATLGLEQLGITLDERGLPDYDPTTMQIGTLPVFIAGDATGRHMVFHEAADEGRIAGYNAVRFKSTAFRRKPPLRIILIHPDIAIVGAAWDQLDQPRTAVGSYWMRDSGRAVLMGEEEGVVRIYADRENGRIIGGALVASQGEHLAHLLAWAVINGFSVEQMLAMPYYHPCIESALSGALCNLQPVLNRERPHLRGLQPL